jgi:hypothetical protein
MRDEAFGAWKIEDDEVVMMYPSWTRCVYVMVRHIRLSLSQQMHMLTLQNQAAEQDLDANT